MFDRGSVFFICSLVVLLFLVYKNIIYIVKMNQKKYWNIIFLILLMFTIIGIVCGFGLGRVLVVSIILQTVTLILLRCTNKN